MRASSWLPVNKGVKASSPTAQWMFTAAVFGVTVLFTILAIVYMSALEDAKKRGASRAIDSLVHEKEVLESERGAVTDKYFLAESEMIEEQISSLKKEL